MHGGGENVKHKTRNKVRQQRGRKVEATTKNQKLELLQHPEVIIIIFYLYIYLFELKQGFIYKMQLFLG